MNNELLMEKLDRMHHDISGINCRLDKLNGQVAKNTLSLAKQTIINGILSAIGLSLIGVCAKIIFF